MNLVINAQAAIPHHGEIHICSSLYKQFNQHNSQVSVAPEYSEKYIKISVADNGCGIPEALYQKVFDPFFTTKDKESGTGLGLSLLINFVEEHKFGLTLNSKLEQGSEFVIWLPVTKSKQIKNVINQTNNDGLMGKHIVVIDDEPLLVELNSLFLTSIGATVKSFTESKLAMDYIIKQHELIDIVATDHFMPGEIQGSDIAQYITQHLSHIPCLIMSGDINDPKLKNLNNLILEKPVSLETLKLELLNLLPI